MSVSFYSIAAEDEGTVTNDVKDKSVVKKNKNAEKNKSCPKRYWNKVVGCGDNCFLNCLGMLLCCNDTFCKKS